jgi:hypothetical protein
MLADIKMRIYACRYLTWKACHDVERTGGRAEELAIMTKVYCSEAAVDAIYDCMRVVGIASYTKDLAPLEKIMRDAMVSPLYHGGNQGVRRRQLHDIFRHRGYDPMLAARGEGLPEARRSVRPPGQAPYGAAGPHLASRRRMPSGCRGAWPQTTSFPTRGSRRTWYWRGYCSTKARGRWPRFRALLGRQTEHAAVP